MRISTPLAVLAGTSLVVVLDGSVVTVALPAIRTDLGLTAAGLAWVPNAYLVAFAGFLLLGGRLGDLVGRRRVLAVGLAVFTAASLVCGLATSAALLVTARFVQGTGAALASAVALAMVATLFPRPAQRAWALGVVSFAQATGGSLGVLLGGVLTQSAGWRWVFLVNVPLGAALLLGARRALPADGARASVRTLDVAGAGLVTAALMTLVGAVVGASGRGGPASAGLAAAAVVLLVAFLARQRTATNPLVPLAALRSRALLAVNVVQLAMAAGLFGFQFTLALLLGDVLGYDPLATGLAYLPTTVAIAVVSVLVAPRLVARAGARAVLLAGVAAAATGLVLLARVPADGGYVADVLAALLLLGTGGGLALPAVMALGMASADRDSAGLASGVLTTTQQVGGALGLALTGAVAATRASGLRAAGAPALAAWTAGYHAAFTVAASALAAAFVLAALALPRRAVAAADARPGREKAAPAVPEPAECR